nr:spidroin-2-like [Aegilops tauschii subsp. strangulata]
MSDQSSFVLINRAIWTVLGLENPLAPNNIDSARPWHKNPCLVMVKGSKLINHRGAAGGVAVEGAGLPSTEGDASCDGDDGAASSSTGAGDGVSVRGREAADGPGEAAGAEAGPTEPGEAASDGPGDEAADAPARPGDAGTRPGDAEAEVRGDVHVPCTSIATECGAAATWGRWAEGVHAPCASNTEDGAAVGSCTAVTEPETGVSVDK